MQAGNTTPRFAGATATQPCAGSFPAGVPRVSAPAVPTVDTFHSPHHCVIGRMGADDPCTPTPLFGPHGCTVARNRVTGCAVAGGRLGQSARERHCPVVKRPTETEFKSRLARSIARRTPLAPAQDAAMVQYSRVPAVVRSRWGRVTSPTPKDMSLYEEQPQDSNDSTAPASLDAYPAGPNHDDLLLCGPANDTEWLMSDVFVGLKEVA